MDARLQELPLDPAAPHRPPPGWITSHHQNNGGGAMEPAAKLMLEASFGSVARWRDEFVAMGKASGGGSGWVLLVYQPREGSLVNQWAGLPLVDKPAPSTP